MFIWYVHLRYLRVFLLFFCLRVFLLLSFPPLRLAFFEAFTALQKAAAAALLFAEAATGSSTASDLLDAQTLPSLIAFTAEVGAEVGAEVVLEGRKADVLGARYKPDIALYALRALNGAGSGYVQSLVGPVDRVEVPIELGRFRTFTGAAFAPRE